MMTCSKTPNRILFSRLLPCILPLALLSTGAAAEDSGVVRPLLAPTYVESPPVLDGKMSEGEWDRIASTTGFLYTDTSLAALQSRVWAAFDEETLYFCFQSSNPGGVKGSTKDHDGLALFVDDAVEVFLQPDIDGPYYQLAANSLDTRFDSEKQISSWNGEWRTASGVEKDKWYVGATWTVEVAIPFATLGIAEAPADGTIWRANLCRDWTAVENHFRATTWAHVGSMFHNPAKFGELLFHRETPVIQFTGFGKLSNGLIALEGVTSAGEEQEIDLEWVASPRPDPRTRTVEGATRMRTGTRPEPFLLEGSVAAPGAGAWPALLSFQIRSGDRTIHRSAIPFDLEPGFSIEIASAFTRKFLEARFDISRLKDVPESAGARIALLDAAGKTLVKSDAPGLGKTGIASVRLDYADAEPGEYSLRMSLVDEKGNTLNEKSQPYTIPEPPEWLGNTLGISDKVPIPFEPVRVDGNAVSMWGRAYDFDQSIFPARIVNQGVEQLARPATLVLERDGKIVEWNRVTTKVVAEKETEAVLNFRAKSKAAKVEGTVTVEYDGWAMFDFTVSPRKGGRIDALRLEIPFPRSEALFMRTHGPIATWAGETMRTALIGDVKNDANEKATEGLRSQFGDAWMPDGWKDQGEFVFQAYVGNDERGLFVVQDTEEHRFLESGNMDIRYEDDVTVLEVKLIDIPTDVDGPLHYRIGLVAVPFKEYRYDLEYLLSMCGGHNPAWVTTNNFEEWIEGGLLWEWGRVEKDMEPHPNHPNRLSDLVKEFENVTMRGVVNSTCMMAPSPHDAFDTYRDEWVIEPPYAIPDHAGSGVDLVMVSTDSSFPDYFLWWAKERIEKDGIGGLYFDMVSPCGSMNSLAGEGWTGENGERHMTSNSFSLRELYKRLYTLVKEEGAKRGKEFYIFQHSAAGPITAFEDHISKGEGFNRERDWRLCTPAFFRAWSLRPLGTTFTMYPGMSAPWVKAGAVPPPHYSAQARTLIHNVLCTALWEEQVATDMFPIWKFRREFDVATAEFVPYYDDDPRVTVSPSSIHASFWHHPGRVMIAAANLTDEPVEAVIELDVEALGIAETIAYADEIRGMDEDELTTPPGERERLEHNPGPTTLPVENGRITITVHPQNYSVVRLR